MDMRLAPLDTTKTEVYKDVWKDCDNPISCGAMCGCTQHFHGFSLPCRCSVSSGTSLMCRVEEIIMAT